MGLLVSTVDGWALSPAAYAETFFVACGACLAHGSMFDFGLHGFGSPSLRWYYIVSSRLFFGPPCFRDCPDPGRLVVRGRSVVVVVIVLRWVVGAGNFPTSPRWHFTKTYIPQGPVEFSLEKHGL